MDINLRIDKPNAFHTIHESKNPIDNRIGFWADVTGVNSQTNRVDLITDTGIAVTGIPVYSSEWVSPKSKNRDYLTASINLPPIGARVFVLMPSRTISGAFVLCSGYAYGEENTKDLFATSKDEANKKNYIKSKITQGGWKESENYKTGNRQIESTDGNIIININPKKDSENSQEQEISLKAWNHTLTITKSEITLDIGKDINIDAGTNNITVNGAIKITGTKFELGGTVTPSGSGALCGISVCPFTGAPHVGSISSNN